MLVGKLACDHGNRPHPNRMSTDKRRYIRLNREIGTVCNVEQQLATTQLSARPHRDGIEKRLTFRSIFLKDTWEKYRWQMVIAAAITSAFSCRARQLSKMNVWAFPRYTFSSLISLPSSETGEQNQH